MGVFAEVGGKIGGEEAEVGSKGSKGLGPEQVGGMMKEVAEQLLAEGVGWGIAVLTAGIADDVVAILQVPAHRPDGGYRGGSLEIAIAPLS